jgi:hypothetical protein
MGRLLRALARSPFTRQRLTMLISRQRGADLETLARLIDAGQLTPVIGMSPGTQVGALAEAAEHQARLLPPARYRHPGDVIRLHVETPASVDRRDRARRYEVT